MFTILMCKWGARIQKIQKSKVVQITQVDHRMHSCKLARNSLKRSTKLRDSQCGSQSGSLLVEFDPDCDGVSTDGTDVDA